MADFPIPRPIRQFSEHFSRAGHSLYIVGGAVRDHLLNRVTTDFDFATDAKPEEVIELFHAVIPTGIKHGTVTVLFKGGSYEVTTFRVEHEYQDHRHPEKVEFVRSLEEDLKRRDFTINALAVHVESGKLIDLHGGKEDLHSKLIRAIGTPSERFSEDALRILRACRFAAQLGFTIEQSTMEAMTALSDNLAHISGERVKSELFKILQSPLPSRGLLAMHACGALDILLPELTAGEEVTQKGAHTYDIMYHGIAACDSVSRNKPLVRLAALLHDIGKVQTKRVSPQGEITFYRHEEHSAKLAKKIMNRLKCSNEERSVVVNLIRNHMFHYTQDWTDGAVRRFINRVGMQSLDDLFALRLADQQAIHGKPRPADIIAFEKHIKRVLESSSALSMQDLAVDGNDLASIGIPKGPVMGIVLKQLLETVLDDPTENEYEKLIEIARNFYEQRIKGPQNHRSPTS